MGRRTGGSWTHTHTLTHARYSVNDQTGRVKLPPLPPLHTNRPRIASMSGLPSGLVTNAFLAHFYLT